MKTANCYRVPSNFLITATITAAISFISVLPATAHGPGGHGDKKITHLQALQKGTTLYDTLIAEGKLPASWETDLVEIRIFPSASRKGGETVVQFSRSSASPRSVYIFFDKQGNYAGSNHTGD